jgi:hypothetical protein
MRWVPSAPLGAPILGSSVGRIEGTARFQDAVRQRQKLAHWCRYDRHLGLATATQTFGERGL